ncbi:hypothetical protein [Aquimarina rhabdastrellae]
MKKILPLIFIVLPFFVFGQLPQEYLRSINNASSMEHYQGSMYLTKKASPSSVTKTYSESLEADLHYNLHTDTFEYKNAKRTYGILKNPSIQIEMDNKKFTYHKFKDYYHLNKAGYYVLLEKNTRYRIFKKYILKILEPEKTLIKSETLNSGKLKLTTSYFLEENNVIIELPKSSKKLLSLFDKHKKEVKEYMKQEKLKLKKEEHLIKILSYFSSIQPQNLLSSMVQSK